MPAYHSAFNTGEAESAQVCGLSMLPLKTRVRGPAPCIEAAAAGEDAVDEALRLFRANVLCVQSVRARAPRQAAAAHLHRPPPLALPLPSARRQVSQL